MTRHISIITAVGPGAPYLPDACASVLDQALPTGWTWEWLVQHDGGGPDELRLPADERIRPGGNRRGGPAIARNMALARATGSLVKVLDADDRLTPGALARDITVLDDATLGWTTSRALDLLPDGTTAGFGGNPDGGRLERGSVLRYWETHDHRASVHPATLCVRRDLLERLGGWMALPASEDTGLLLALDAVAPGYFCPEVGLLYRKWPGQVTAAAEHVDPVEREARMALVGRRARRLLADSGGS
jgi:glycosyltransferase involved in cell wall biosynthesis